MKTINIEINVTFFTRKLKDGKWRVFMRMDIPEQVILRDLSFPVPEKETAEEIAKALNNDEYMGLFTTTKIS